MGRHLDISAFLAYCLRPFLNVTLLHCPLLQTERIGDGTTASVRSGAAKAIPATIATAMPAFPAKPGLKMGEYLPDTDFDEFFGISARSSLLCSRAPLPLPSLAVSHKYSTCSSCTPGYYQPDYRRKYCLASPTGRYVDQYSRSSTKACPAGHYQDQTAKVCRLRATSLRCQQNRWH